MLIIPIKDGENIDKALKRFKNSQVKILKTFKHDSSIRMGGLKGNRFSINLQYVDIYKYDCLYIVDMGLKDFLCKLDIPYLKIAFLCI